MNKFLSIVTLIASLNIAAFAETPNITASVDAGYDTSYLVNNVSQAEDAVTTGVKVGATYFGVDFFARGLFLADTSQGNGSRWGVGLGKSFGIIDGLSLKVDGAVDRAQTGQANIADYTEADLKLSLRNNFFIPYIKGAYQVELDQYGYTVGVEKPFELFKFITVNPALEYTKMTDYEAYAAKITVSKTVWKNLSVFAQGAYIDNNFFGNNINFAVKQLNGSMVGSGGIKWSF
jgi:hypothetical protein